jgi:hypothetical protein
LRRRLADDGREVAMRCRVMRTTSKPTVSVPSSACGSSSVIPLAVTYDVPTTAAAHHEEKRAPMTRNPIQGAIASSFDRDAQKWGLRLRGGP